MDRFIPMPPDLAEHLKATQAKARSPYVIADGAWRPASVEAMGAEFHKQVIVPARLRGRLHILRHTYASHLAAAGCDPWRLQRLLGHSKLSTTEIYAHLMPDALDDAAKLLPKIPV